MGSLSTTKRLNVQIIHNILVKNVLTTVYRLIFHL